MTCWLVSSKPSLTEMQMKSVWNLTRRMQCILQFQGQVAPAGGVLLQTRRLRQTRRPRQTRILCRCFGLKRLLLTTVTDMVVWHWAPGVR